MTLTDDQVIAELVRCRAARRDGCALQALKDEHGLGGLLTDAAFLKFGVSVATAYGIMVGWDGPESVASFGRAQRHSPEDFDRGVAIGRAVREAVQP